jgi:uncharacterized cupin superfamily protein
MADVTKKAIAEIAHYQGQYAIPGIKFRYAGKELGVTAWGMNVIEMEPGVTAYPEHDHVKDGQEEVYVILRGSATLRAGEQEWPLQEGDLVRVGPETRRKILPGPQGATVLAIGATPGQAYPAK